MTLPTISPSKLRPETYFTKPTRLLATVMLLPLLDGLFVALVVTGALDTTIGMLEVGILVFGGSATITVILANPADTHEKHIKTVLWIGMLVIVLATLEAALAATIQTVVDLEIFTRFAALVILSIAIQTATDSATKYLPPTSIILLIAILASATPETAAIVFDFDVELILRAVATATIGAAFALLLVLFAPVLREHMHMKRLRIGGGIALATLSLSIVSITPEGSSLFVLAASLAVATNWRMLLQHV